MNAIITAENIDYTVNSGGIFSSFETAKTILKNISFTVEKGSLLGIAGESGSGKTTLAKIIAGIIKPTKGKLEYNKELLKTNLRFSPVQILFQNNGEILNPLREIENVIEEALFIRFKDKTNLQKQKNAVFESVDFPEELRKKKGFQLSGGEQQRAALARLLAVEPDVLILDEPFSAQDPESQLNLLNLFGKLNHEKGITMICIAHNLQILNKLCEKIIIMYKGEIVESGNAEEIFSSPRHEYTKFLIKAGSYNLSSAEVLSKSGKFTKTRNSI